MESVEFTSITHAHELLDLVESNNIARERGVTFHNWKNLIMPMVLLDKYTTGEFVPKSDRVKELFKDILSQVLRIGQNCVLKFKQMVFTTKTA